MSSYDYDMLGSKEYTEVISSSNSKKFRPYPKYFDFEKFEQDTRHIQEGGITKFKPVPGVWYNISFIPFKIGEGHPKYQEIAKRANGRTPIADRIPFNTHSVKGPTGYGNRIICPEKTFGRRCPICEKGKAMYRGGRDAARATYSKEELDLVKDSKRDIFLIHNEEEKKFYLFDASVFTFSGRLGTFLSMNREAYPQVILAKPDENQFSLRFYFDQSTVQGAKGEPLPGQAQGFTLVPRPHGFSSQVLDQFPLVDQYLVVYSPEVIESFIDGTYWAADEEEEFQPTSTAPPVQTVQPPPVYNPAPPVQPQYVQTPPPPPPPLGTGTQVPPPPQYVHTPVPPSPGSYSGETEMIPFDSPAQIDKEDFESGQKDRIVIGKRPDNNFLGLNGVAQASIERTTDKTCPVPGGKFGVSAESFTECVTCPLHDACVEEFDSAYQN